MNEIKIEFTEANNETQSITDLPSKIIEIENKANIEMNELINNEDVKEVDNGDM
jgi:hypothetical protein